MSFPRDWQPVSYEAVTGEPFEHAIRALNAVELALEIREAEPLRHAALALIAVTPPEPTRKGSLEAQQFATALETLQSCLLYLAELLDLASDEETADYQHSRARRWLRLSVGALDAWQRSVLQAARRTVA